MERVGPRDGDSDPGAVEARNRQADAEDHS